MRRNNSNGSVTSFSIQLISLTLAVSVTLVTTGCETARDYSLTRKLWSDGADLEGPYHRPAQQPNVQLFQTKTGDDLLVQYDELKDGRGTPTRRTYLLLENNSRTSAHQKPNFTAPTRIDELTAIPIRISAAPTAEPATLYAVIDEQRAQFTLHGEQWDRCPYSLPKYSTDHTPVARVALTPLALAGDVVMVGLAAGIVGAVLWVSAGGPGANCH